MVKRGGLPIYQLPLPKADLEESGGVMGVLGFTKLGVAYWGPDYKGLLLGSRLVVPDYRKPPGTCPKSSLNKLTACAARKETLPSEYHVAAASLQ